MMLFGEKYGDEVRAGRDRRLLARALRRHARALDRGDRAVRDHLRELGRLGHTADRGRHLGRGLRAAARPRARRPTSCAASWSGRGKRGAEAGPRRSRCEVEPRSEEAIGGVNVFVGQASGRGRRGAAGGVRPDQAGARAGRGRARRGRGRARPPRRQLRPARSRGGSTRSQVIRRPRREVGGGGGGRPTMARAGGTRPREARRRARARREEALRRGARVKVVALDYGSARTGVAVSDPTGHDRAAARRGRARRERGRARAARRADRATRAPSASSSACR